MATQNPIRTLRLGDKCPAFDLPTPSGQRYSLASFKDANFLAVLFLANHCPYVGSWEDRIVAIGKEYPSRGVAFVAISSNDASKFPQDTPEEMVKRAEEREYPFPYLYDEDQSVARSFGASRTPEVFVFDEERILRYHGAIDSDWEESSGMENYLRDALDRLTTGGSVYLPETPPVGCVLKYRS